HHVARIGAPKQVRFGSITSKTRSSVAPSVGVSFAAFDFGCVGLVRNPHRIQIKVRLVGPREMIDILEAVLCSRPEPSGHGVWLCPNISLDPSPPHVLQGQHQLVYIRMALSPEWTAVCDAVLDVEDQAACRFGSVEHPACKGKKPFNITVR